VVFWGEVLPVTEVLRLAEEALAATVRGGVLPAAAGHARDAAELVAGGELPTAG